jgi:hypothetical protein
MIQSGGVLVIVGDKVIVGVRVIVGDNVIVGVSDGFRVDVRNGVRVGVRDGFRVGVRVAAADRDTSFTSCWDVFNSGTTNCVAVLDISGAALTLPVRFNAQPPQARSSPIINAAMKRRTRAERPVRMFCESGGVGCISVISSSIA